MSKKPRNSFEADDGTKITVTEMPGSRAGSRTPAFHFGVICGDDASTFMLRPEAGALLRRALEALTDASHRRH